jgi:hypothetical protein
MKVMAHYDVSSKGGTSAGLAMDLRVDHRHVRFPMAEDVDPAVEAVLQLWPSSTLCKARLLRIPRTGLPPQTGKDFA